MSPRDKIFAHGDKIIANLHEEETTFYCCTKIEDQTTLPGNRGPNNHEKRSKLGGLGEEPCKRSAPSRLEASRRILHRKDHITAEEAWEEHKHLEAFNKVVFSQFKKQLQLHREQVNREMQLSDKEELAMHHDRNLFPRQPTNKRGEKACDLHPAKDLLREIVRLNLHEGMKPSELQEATRGRPGNEFADFKPVKFKEKLCQEIRRKKFFNCVHLQEKKKPQPSGLEFECIGA